MTRGWYALGVALVAGHAVLGAVVVAGVAPESLRVVVSGAEPKAIAAATVPSSLRERVQYTVDGRPAADSEPTTGLHRHEWTARYRGGFERRVGLSQIVGPFQNPDEPPCGVRLHLGQRLLDDGRAGAGTLASVARSAITRALRDTRVVGLGRFEHVVGLALRWSERGGGSLELRATLQYRRAQVPFAVVATPTMSGGVLRWKTRTRARVRVDSDSLAWVLDAVGLQSIIDGEATEAGGARVNAIANALSHASDALPPIELGSLGEIRVEYCDEPVVVEPGVAATVPLRLAAPATSANAGNLPAGAVAGAVAFGADEVPPVPADVALAIDIDLDTINAVAFQLHASGVLDHALDVLEAEKWFNQSPLVQRLLSVRLSEIRLALPPVFEPSRAAGADPLSLALEAEIELDDKGLRTRARLFGRLGLAFHADGEAVPSGGFLRTLDIRDLALTCRPAPEVYVPCYTAIVDAMRGRSRDLFEPVSRRLSTALAQWTDERRWRIAGGGAFAIERARVGNFAKGRTVWLRFAADARFIQ